jgi:hypothetical protein
MQKNIIRLKGIKMTNLHKKIVIILTVIICFTTSCQSAKDKSNSEIMALEEAKKVISNFKLSTVNSIEFLDKEKYFELKFYHIPVMIVFIGY